MRAVDGFTTAALVANSATFSLIGGGYILAFVKAGTQTVKVSQLGPDGSTWLDACPALTASGLSALLYLPPGQYRLTATTADSSAAALTRVPME